MPAPIVLPSGLSRYSFTLERMALFLDVDGTLLDIAPRPDAVVVPKSLRTALATLQQKLGGALALVSGRRIAELDRLFGENAFVAAGAHGAELRLKPAEPAHVHAHADLGEGLRNALASSVADMPGVRVEDKALSIALHYRATPESGPQVEAAARAAVTSQSSDARLLHGKAVVEVKRPGYDKGSAIRSLMEQTPFAGRLPVFAGDDVTDEAGLAMVREMDGLPLLVGRSLPGYPMAFSSPRDVRSWLTWLAGRPLQACVYEGE